MMELKMQFVIATSRIKKFIEFVIRTNEFEAIGDTIKIKPRNYYLDHLNLIL